jgi:hypothetical protein
MSAVTEQALAHRQQAIRDVWSAIACAAASAPCYFALKAGVPGLWVLVPILALLLTSIGAFCFLLMANATDSAYRLARKACVSGDRAKTSPLHSTASILLSASCVLFAAGCTPHAEVPSQTQTSPHAESPATPPSRPDPAQERLRYRSFQSLDQYFTESRSRFSSSPTSLDRYPYPDDFVVEYGHLFTTRIDAHTSERFASTLAYFNSVAKPQESADISTAFALLVMDAHACNPSWRPSSGPNDGPPYWVFRPFHGLTFGEMLMRVEPLLSIYPAVADGLSGRIDSAPCGLETSIFPTP